MMPSDAPSAGSASIDGMTAIARREFDELPEAFKTLCGDLVIRVAEWPPEDALADLGLDEPLELLGLFEGIGLAQAPSAGETGALPNRIWLFRRPILAFHAEGEDTLDALIRHVLVHEIGHHFGLSDADMEAIDDAED